MIKWNAERKIIINATTKRPEMLGSPVIAIQSSIIRIYI